MLRTNAERLVKIAVEGRVAPAIVWGNEVGHDGLVHNVPGVGGITYNVLVGDPAFGWMGDHIEPGVSTLLSAEKRTDKPNYAYNFLACAGNEAIVVSGKASGKRGIAIGHHGGVEHVMIDFPAAVLEKLTNDDRIQIRAYGQGLKLIDFPHVRVASLDPRLLGKLKLHERGGRLNLPVAASVPGKLMGSGLGSLNTHTGDFDIMTADQKLIARHELDRLRLGDLVAIIDIDASFGWCYREGAVTIGIIIHGDSHASGHGPGVTTILTSATGHLVPTIDRRANIGRYLGIGRFRA